MTDVMVDVVCPKRNVLRVSDERRNTHGSNQWCYFYRLNSAIDR